MLNPYFISGTNRLDFTKSYNYPLGVVDKIPQVQLRTASGKLYVYQKGPAIRQMIVKFEGLPRGSEANPSALTDYLGLRYWYVNVAKGAMNPFTFYDAKGESNTVRMMTDMEDFEERDEGLYEGKVILEKA